MRAAWRVHQVASDVEAVEFARFSGARRAPCEAPCATARSRSRWSRLPLSAPPRQRRPPQLRSPPASRCADTARGRWRRRRARAWPQRAALASWAARRHMRRALAARERSAVFAGVVRLWREFCNLLAVGRKAQSASARPLRTHSPRPAFSGQEPPAGAAHPAQRLGRARGGIRRPVSGTQVGFSSALGRTRFLNRLFVNRRKTNNFQTQNYGM